MTRKMVLISVALVFLDHTYICFIITFKTWYTYALKSKCSPTRIIVLPRSNGYVYKCLFVNIEIKTFGCHIRKSGVVLKTICCQHG